MHATLPFDLFLVHMYGQIKYHWCIICKARMLPYKNLLPPALYIDTDLSVLVAASIAEVGFTSGADHVITAG